jgi:hypothetical protein
LGNRNSTDSVNWIAADVRRNCLELKGLVFGVNSNTVDGLYNLSLGLHNDLVSQGVEHTWWTFGLGHTYPFAADLVTILKWFQTQFASATKVETGKELSQPINLKKSMTARKLVLLTRERATGYGIVVIDPQHENLKGRRVFSLTGASW